METTIITYCLNKSTVGQTAGTKSNDTLQM